MIDKYNEVGIDPIETLERINQSKAKPMTKCIYPKCEECDKYHGHYCTVPMVISKQIWCEIAEKMHKLEQRLTELETLVTDEIFASEKTARPRDEELNLTWADVLGEDE